MNYSEYLESLEDNKEPIYQKEGSLPQCPPGYRWDRKKKDCVPKTEKDSIKGKLDDKGSTSGNASYNVWGRTGMNGDGYAFEEPAGMDANSSHWDSH